MGTDIVIRTFKKKPHDIEAVQVNYKNMEAVVEWCGGKKNPPPTDFGVPSTIIVYNWDGSMLLAQSGDWVYHDSVGFGVIPPDYLKKHYEEVVETK